MISPALTQALRAGRGRYNALFAQARRQWPRMDPAAMLELLRRRIDPVAAAVEAAAPEQVPATVEALYAIALELLGRRLLGLRSRDSAFERLWSDLMLGAAAKLALSPERVAASLSNALYNLTHTPRCRADDWTRTLLDIADACDDAEQFLAAGQVAAWTCGMAQYRMAALETARSLPPRLVARLLLPPDAAEMPIDELLQQLAADPWRRPGRSTAQSRIRIVAEAGGFRGFGGEFARPPRVAAVDGQLYAGDGDGNWMLLADAYGLMLHRVAGELPADASGGRFTLNRRGKVKGPDGSANIGLLEAASSHASNDSTLAVTLPHSHQVFLVAAGPA